MVANPVPKDQEIPATDLQEVIENALNDARQNNITGKAVTPFLLDKIRISTKGKSLESNQALVINNAKIAAQIAMAFAAD